MSGRDYEQVAKPGSIVFMRGSCDLEDSYFGVVPHLNQDFNTGKYERLLGAFNSQSRRNFVQVPCWFMRNDFNWRLYIAELHNGCKVIGDLLDEHEGRRKLLMGTFECFTYRDGSRYYCEFFDSLVMFQNILLNEDAYSKYAPKVCRVHSLVLESIRKFRLPTTP